MDFNLLEFIQNNIIFVVGALIFVYKLFFSGRSEKQQQTFGGDKRVETTQDNDYDEYEDDKDDEDYYDNEKGSNLEERRRQEEQLREEERIRELNMRQREEAILAEQRHRYEQQQRIIASMQNSSQQNTRSIDHSRQAMRQDVESATQNQSTHVSLSHNELRKAILWSEVLGPPRAKRPFRK